jgi:hypothetical protein
VNKSLLFIAVLALINTCVQTTCAVVRDEPVYYFVAAAFLFASAVSFAGAVWYSR